MTKPLDGEVLKLTVEQALGHTGFNKENNYLTDNLSADFDLKNIFDLLSPCCFAGWVFSTHHLKSLD